MMTLRANKQRMCIGCILLAALLLLGFNGYRFMALEDQPLEGYSAAIKSIDRKMAQLEKGLAVKAESHDGMAGLELSLARYTKATDAAQHMETVAVADPVRPPKTRTDKASAKQEQILLPACSGIIQVQNAVGALGYKAVLDGKLVQVEDRILDFTVHAITPESVVLSRLGRKWSIAGPLAAYTRDSGE